MIVEQVEPATVAGIVRLGGEVHLEMLPPDGGIPEHEEVVAENIVETPAVEIPVITEPPINSVVAGATVTTEDHRTKMQEAWARRFQNLNKKDNE